MRIVKGDLVVVTTGDDKGTTPRKVLRIVESGERIVIENVNRVYRHVKKGHPKSPQGGRLSIELPVDASNVLPYCTKCGRGVKVAYKVNEAGDKQRCCRKCASPLVASGK